MKRAIRTATAAALASLCLYASAGAKVVTIVIPDAQYVTPVGINDRGQVTGTWQDASGSHGFLWQPDGTLATFDVPGALDTLPAGISATGVIAGRYSPTGHGTTGFVRAADGTITTFDVPKGKRTIVSGENSRGWSVGTYAHNTRGPYLAFLRAPSGATTEFSAPGAANTSAVAVNRSRMIAGEAGGPSYQAFLRTADGAVTVFGNPDDFTQVAGMNDDGTIAGYISHQDYQAAYVRTIDGTITTFVAPNGHGTYPYAINNSGTIAGTFGVRNKDAHGFLRTADGTFTPFRVAGSQSTQILALNNRGAIAGRYENKDGVWFAFAGKP